MRSLAIPAILAVAACTPKAPVEPIATTADMCMTTDTQPFVGRAYSDQVATEIRAKTKATTVRAVRPGQMVTMEYNAQRVTITLDASDRITRVACG